MNDITVRFQDRYDNFDKFRKQFSNFDDFRKPFENRDIGLQRAVAISLRDHIRSTEFPPDIYHQDEKIMFIFEMADGQDISTTKLANLQRNKKIIEAGNPYGLLLKRWARRSYRLKKPPADDTEVLIIFYYLTNFIEDRNGKTRDRFWGIVLRELEPEGAIPARREEYFFNEQKNGDSEFVEKPPLKQQKGELRIQPKNAHRIDDGGSPSELLLKILDRITGEGKLHAFIMRLDWSEKEGAFRFNPNEFHNRPEEMLLDRVLYNLSLAGGIIRRGEIGLKDAVVLRGWVQIIMGNKEVHSYLNWIHSPDQIPDHVDFLDAIYLYEQFGGEIVSEFAEYRERAEKVLNDLENLKKNSP